MRITEYMANRHAEAVRLANAKTAIATAIAGKGVTVPDGTLLDGMAPLIASIETGVNATGGTITVSSDVINYVLTQGLGEVPKFFVIGMMEDFDKLTGKTYILIGAFGFSDVRSQYRISTSSNVHAPSGIFKGEAITATNDIRQSIVRANEETITVAYSGGSHKLIAGATYYWVAVGSGVF